MLPDQLILRIAVMRMDIYIRKVVFHWVNNVRHLVALSQIRIVRIFTNLSIHNNYVYLYFVKMLGSYLFVYIHRCRRHNN